MDRIPASAHQSLRNHLLRWWGALHMGERIRNRAVRGILARELAHRTPTCILDAGCGRGENAWWCARTFPSHRTDAVDLDPRAIGFLADRIRSSGRTHCTARVADLADIPDDRRYGIVYSVDVFEHLHDPAAALRALTARLEPNGVLILHVPFRSQRRWFRRFARYEQHDHEREGFAREELEALARGAGLTVTDLRYTFGPPGALAWELFHILQGIGRPLVLLAYPALWLLARADGWFQWKRGNGILVVIENRKSKL